MAHIVSSALPLAFRSSVLALAVAALSGCGASLKDAKTLVDVSPAGRPALVGTYDFDILGDVEGTGCASVHERVLYRTATTGVALGHEYGLLGAAESAAMFDAVGKIKGADTLFVSRARSEGDPTSRVCTTIWGKAVRLKKGPTVVPTGTAAVGSPAAAESGAPPADPAPVRK